MAKTLAEKIEQLRSKLIEINLLGQFEHDLNRVTNDKDFLDMVGIIIYFCRINNIQIVESEIQTIGNDYDASHPYPDFNPAE